MCSECGWDQEEWTDCPNCNGDGMVKPAGAGYSDDLPEYERCSVCDGFGQIPQ